MNKERRKTIADIASRVGNLYTHADALHADVRAAVAAFSDRLGTFETLVEELQSEIEDVENEEQEYFDSMPESLQGGDKGSAASDAIDNLSNAKDFLDSIVSDWRELITACETVTDFDVSSIESNADEAVSHLENASA